MADLARDDFVLLQEGREQPIRLFSTESNQPLPGVEPLPPNTFSNHLERPGRDLLRQLHPETRRLEGIHSKYSDS